MSANSKQLESFSNNVGDEQEKGHISFPLPNGAKIVAGTCGDADPTNRNTCGWSSIDVVLVLPNGERAVLCAVDFELAGGSRTHDVLRVLAYDNDDEEPSYDSEFPWQHYSYWLQHEKADDTYDICFWDEFRNERGEQMEEARFPSEEAAMKRLSEIQRGKEHIWWIRRDDTIGEG